MGLACDSSRGGKLRRAEEEAEQRNRRQMRTAKKRVRFSPVTEIQMLPLEEEDQNAENEEQTTLLDTTTIQMPRPAPLEEDDEDSEDEEATPLNTTVIQMSTLEEDHNSDEEQTLWAQDPLRQTGFSGTLQTFSPPWSCAN